MTGLALGSLNAQAQTPQEIHEQETRESVRKNAQAAMERLEAEKDQIIRETQMEILREYQKRLTEKELAEAQALAEAAEKNRPLWQKALDHPYFPHLLTLSIVFILGMGALLLRARKR